MKTQLVWITESSKSESDNFELFSRCINQYPILCAILKFLDPLDIHLLHNALRHCQGTQEATQAEVWADHLLRIKLAPSAGMPHRYPLSLLYSDDKSLKHNVRFIDMSQPDQKPTEEHKEFRILNIITYGEGHNAARSTDPSRRSLNPKPWDIWGELTDKMVFRAYINPSSYRSASGGYVVIYPSWEAIFESIYLGALERFICSLNANELCSRELLSNVQNRPLLTMYFTSAIFEKLTAEETAHFLQANFNF